MGHFQVSDSQNCAKIEHKQNFTIAWDNLWMLEAL